MRPVATTLSEQQLAASLALTQAYKAQANREAAKIALAISLYYRVRVDPESPQAVEAWLLRFIPSLISASDSGAARAAVYYDSLRRLELGTAAPAFRATPATGYIDEGVRKSLLSVGPYDYVNKIAEIKDTANLSEGQRQAMIAEAKEVTAKKVASAVVRHAQAGGRQTVHENSQTDKEAIGWIRVTRAEPCYFCAALASRGIHYRPFKEGSFDLSNARFSGEGDAKVHDECGCSLKPVYASNDFMLKQNKRFQEMWSMWGAGGGDAMLRFRRGYDHFRETGEYLTHEQASAPLAA